MSALDTLTEDELDRLIKESALLRTIVDSVARRGGLNEAEAHLAQDAVDIRKGNGRNEARTP